MNCFVDYRTTTEEINNLITLNIEPIIVPKSPLVYGAIDGHVDIQLNIINKDLRKIIVHKDIPTNFLELLRLNNITYIFSKKSLSKKYPENIILNSLITDDFFIHNLKFTDQNLLDTQKGKKFINIQQGYTKCSVLPITDTALITSDIGIYNNLDKNIFDVLLIPAGDILLPSLDYGFIGGTGGMLPNNKLGLYGELKHYKYGQLIYDFLYKYDVEPISLRKGKLIDRGSLLTI